MSEALIGDALGPRARRKVRIGSVVALLALAAFVAFFLRRLSLTGQLEPELYTALLDPALPGYLGEGLLLVLRIAAVSMLFATAVGGVLALGRLSRAAPLRLLSGAYVEFFRAMPVLMLILFSRFGLPALGLPTFDVSTYIVFALVAYNSAVLCEIFRAGILSLDRGQSEAAYAIGLRYWQAMGIVIIPQAVRRMLPAIVSQLVTLLKDTSLGYIIGLRELLRRGQSAGELLGNRPQMLVLVALIYVAVNFALSRFAVWLEQWQGRRGTSPPAPVEGGGTDELAVGAPTSTARA
jgi:glutamate transport system permease protein